MRRSRAALPDVLTLEWPLETERAIAFLQHTWEFDPIAATKEDRSDAALQGGVSNARKLQSQTLTFADFIERLNLVVDIDPLVADDVRRASR
jgi:predicted enzyme involved in methoxymalonyl-ACP biosynthesis